MNFFNWQRNIDLALIEMNNKYKGSVEADKVKQSKENVGQILSNNSNLESGGDTFNLTSGAPSYNQGVFNAADSMIKGIDSDGDGIISREEFINDGLKNQTEFYKQLGMEKLSDEEREAITKGFGNAFDTLNVNKDKDKNKVDGIDRKEMAAYIAKLDDADGMDGKINYSTKSNFDGILANGRENNKNVMLNWYNAIFQKGKDDGVPKAE